MGYVNLDMRSEIVPQYVFKPIGDRKKQTQWKGEDNINPSVVDPYFQRQRELGIVDPKGEIENGVGRIVRQIFHATQHEADLNSLEVLFLTEHIQSLKDHLDARLCAYFRQLVDVYGRPQCFEIGKVEDQLESSKALPWRSADGRTGTLSFESAHYGTLPCIIAYPEAEYRLWKTTPQNNPKPAGHIFGKYSDTYHSNNGCGGHLKIVNEADSIMDYKGGADVNLRPFALELLNASAQKRVDPMSGMRLLVGKLSASVETLLATRREPSLQLIFQTYRDHLAHIRTMIEEEPHAFFTFLLGVEINEEDPRIHKLKTVIYPNRFMTLQRLSTCQSQIAARVALAKERVLGGVGRKPRGFDQAFKAHLILQAKQKSERIGKVMQRHFCMHAAYAQKAWDDCTTKKGHSVAQRKCLRAQAEIDALLADIQKLTHNYSVNKSLLRANLLRQLRESHSWSQTLVAYKVNQISPGENLYQKQVSRLELGQKKISKSLAGTLSQVFNVHRSVFISDAKIH